MDKFVAMVMVAVALFLAGCASSAPASEPETRASCLEKAAAVLGEVDYDDGLRALVELARSNYHNESFVEDYVRPELPQSCFAIQDKLDSLYADVPCFADQELMGEQLGKNEVDLVTSSQSAKNVIEAFFACQGGLMAGQLMSYFDLLKAYQ